METENEQRQEEKSVEQNAGSRDGYQTPGHSDSNYQNFRPAGRSPRPRIHNPRPYGEPDKGYYAKGDNDESGFRPEGFGANLQGSAPRQGGYRPHFNNNEGGYQQRSGGYANRQQGSYRPRYNNNDGEQGSFQQQGGYQQRGYNRQQGGYRPRYNNNDGGFQQRSGGYGNRQQGDFRPRYGNNDGEQGSFQQQGGYQQRGYNRQQGGYRPRYNNNDGGFQQRSGGYGNRQQGDFRPRYGNNDGEQGSFQQQGGYQQRGYGRQQGGYQSRGGYNNRGGYQQRGGYNNYRGGYRQHSADYDPNAKYSLKKRIEYKEEHHDPNEPIRLNKFLANAGVCSRREADTFIQAGVVSVNGTVVTELGTKIMRTDEVKFHDEVVKIEKKVYVLLNKPKDYVTTSDDPQHRKTVMDLVKGACPERIYPVGRLDRNTTGVLLLTNDGDLASKLTHPKFLKKKIYHVFLDHNITAHDLQQIRDGITLEDGEIKADAVEYADQTDKKQVGIEIHSGKNRIVRRIFESLGYKVTKLDRVQFAGLTKKNVRRGDWRYLTEEEVDRLRMGAYE